MATFFHSLFVFFFKIAINTGRGPDVLLLPTAKEDIVTSLVVLQQSEKKFEHHNVHSSFFTMLKVPNFTERESSHWPLFVVFLAFASPCLNTRAPA